SCSSIVTLTGRADRSVTTETATRSRQVAGLGWFGSLARRRDRHLGLRVGRLADRQEQAVHRDFVRQGRWRALGLSVGDADGHTPQGRDLDARPVNQRQLLDALTDVPPKMRAVLEATRQPSGEAFALWCYYGWGVVVNDFQIQLADDVMR